MIKLLFILLLITGCATAPKNTNLQVYAILLEENSERKIERLFKTESAAVKYINDYKDNHIYYLEVIELDK